MRLLLVRHGETEHNRTGIVLGRKDVPLNDLGLRQAAALEFALAEEKIDAIYASPLQRTLQTAKAIATPHELTVAMDDRLMEMDVGELEGMTGLEMREKHPELMANWGGPNGPSYKMPGSDETLTTVQARSRQAIEAITAAHSDGAVVVVSHNFVILVTLAWMLNIELVDFRRLRQSVAAISSVEIKDSSVQVITLNDTCHLRGIG
ncbi:MAG: histidine phosphatase family protein [Chloroflexota bacterium]